MVTQDSGNVITGEPDSGPVFIWIHWVLSQSAFNASSTSSKEGFEQLVQCM